MIYHHVISCLLCNLMKMFHWKTSLSRVIIIRRYKFEMSPTQFEWNKRGHPKFDNNVAIFVYIIKCVRVLEFQGGWPEGWRISSSQTNSMEIAGRKIYIRCMDHLKLTKYSNTAQFIFDVDSYWKRSKSVKSTVFSL